MASSAEDALADARAQLVARLDGQTYRPLVDWILRPVSSLGRRSFSREPYPSWLTSLVIVPVVLMVGYVAGRIGGEAEVYGGLLSLSVSAAMAAAGMALCTDLLTRMMQLSLAEAVVPNMLERADVQEIERRLERIFDPRRQLLFTLVAGAALFASLLWAAREHPEIRGIGLWTNSLALSLASASALYFSAPMLSFLPRLGRLRLQLYQANPRDSFVIVSLERTAKHALYVFGALCALMSVIAARHGLFENPWLEAGMLTCLWVPLTVSFIGANTTFRAMIVRSKWAYLSRLQARIEALQDDPAFPADGTLERAQQLMAHHDEVRATANETSDHKAWLAYINSMLLPFIAGTLGNLDQIKTWLGLAGGA